MSLANGNSGDATELGRDDDGEAAGGDGFLFVFWVFAGEERDAAAASTAATRQGGSDGSSIGGARVRLGSGVWWLFGRRLDSDDEGEAGG